MVTGPAVVYLGVNTCLTGFDIAFETRDFGAKHSFREVLALHFTFRESGFLWNILLVPGPNCQYSYQFASVVIFLGGRVDFGANLVLNSNCDPENARFER